MYASAKGEHKRFMSKQSATHRCDNTNRDTFDPAYLNKNREQKTKTITGLRFGGGTRGRRTAGYCNEGRPERIRRHEKLKEKGREVIRRKERGSTRTIQGAKKKTRIGPKSRRFETV